MAKSFGARIHDLIVDNGTTAKQVATDLGISEQTISNWRRSNLGKKSEKDEYVAPEIGCRELVMLANYFHVSTDYLLGLSDNPAADTGAESVAQYVHLSDKSVNILHNASNPTIMVLLDYLICDSSAFKKDLQDFFYGSHTTTGLVTELIQLRQSYTNYLMEDPSKFDTYMWIVRYQEMFNLAVTNDFLEERIENRPHLAHLTIYNFQNRLDLLLADIYCCYYRCDSLNDLKALSKQIVDSGKCAPSYYQETDGDRALLERIYKFSFFKDLVDTILQNRSKEDESTDK